MIEFNCIKMLVGRAFDRKEKNGIFANWHSLEAVNFTDFYLIFLFESRLLECSNVDDCWNRAKTLRL